MTTCLSATRFDWPWTRRSSGSLKQATRRPRSAWRGTRLPRCVMLGLLLTCVPFPIPSTFRQLFRSTFRALRSSSLLSTMSSDEKWPPSCEGSSDPVPTLWSGMHRMPSPGCTSLTSRRRFQCYVSSDGRGLKPVTASRPTQHAKEPKQQGPCVFRMALVVPVGAGCCFLVVTARLRARLDTWPRLAGWPSCLPCPSASRPGRPRRALR